MDKRKALLLRKLQRVLACLVIDISIQDDPCAVAFCAVYLDQGRRCRHDNRSRDPIDFSSVGHALRMVPRRCGDKPLCTFFLTQSTNLVISTPHLVGPGILHILRFQVHLVPRLLRKILTINQVCRQNYLFYLICGFLKFFQCHHCHFPHFYFQTMHLQTHLHQISANHLSFRRFRYI